MFIYNYTARNASSGQLVKATVEAENEQSASKLIKAQGLSPLTITRSKTSQIGFLKFLNRVRSKDKVLFARQLSTLINAGLPLIQAIRTVEEQTSSKQLKIILADIVTTIESGQSFAKAISKYPDTFNPVFQNLVAAGETSGTLDKSLERIAIQQEKDADIVSKLRGAMTYPVIVLLVMVAIVVFMLVKVLPQVQILYVSFPGASLPIETKALLSLSNFVTSDWYIVLIVVVALIVGFTYWRKTKSGRSAIDKSKLVLPGLKTLFEKLYMARFTRTASTLVAAGVPLLQVMDICAKSVINIHVARSINLAADKVKGGKSLGEALANEPFILSLVPSMIKIGEKSGSMEDMLDKTANYYENEVDQFIKNISTIIEPVMMVLLGVIALIIVAAVLLPIYSLAASGAISNVGN
jgi:type II secretory pathway component PulF